VPFGKTIHYAETFYVVVEGQVVINGVEIIEALFLTYSQFYKERYIARSSTCSTKELSIHLTKILSAVKEGMTKSFMNGFF
jgi:hypothetical protein